MLAATTMARGQQPGRTYRIADVTPTFRNSSALAAMLDEVGRRGFAEGRNLTVDPRGFGLRPEQYAQVAAELVADRIDVILATGDPAIRAVQKATATIPILGSTDDMVGEGLVASMARPGGNTTGTSILSPELDGKRQELLLGLVPGVHRIAALADASSIKQNHLRELEDAAKARGVELSIHPVAEPEQIAPAIDAAKAGGAEALNVLASPFMKAAERIIIARAAAIKLPAIYQFPEMAEAGGLAGYGPRIDRVFRDLMAPMLVKLLNGAKPADLPIEQPTQFEFVVNMKTAKGLGLTLAQRLLAQADEVIE
ncbi:MAG TPA: ABC transporter substrate-binding protein [Stellaceae bacterium]|nr:ABC transporter substrate-binding protein [Stellaceae bacterium]